ncbi:DUF5004 domain-containing protein [Hymenobacter sp. BT175]|uniref:DUF5004 domain-containing protein n=1 Tax=Hymenobacter translucens TaxID=2886507 RepID=UPI001D0EABEC|nr:DUF5004 domain-containing protein [Hymenobacter translucens]MCC2548271.1 DUF5004 domain-containing protein [Hymenobacter translucens]
MMKISGLWALGALSWLSACTKQESKSQVLSGKDWLLTDVTATTPAAATADIYAQFSRCDQDDFVRFDAVGAYHYDEGRSRCDASTPQTSTGSWRFSANENIISIVNPNSSFSGDFRLEELSATSLRLSQTYSSGHRMTFRLTRR